jgi:hypothetical protein
MLHKQMKIMHVAMLNECPSIRYPIEEPNFISSLCWHWRFWHGLHSISQLSWHLPMKVSWPLVGQSQRRFNLDSVYSRPSIQGSGRFVQITLIKSIQLHEKLTSQLTKERLAQIFHGKLCWGQRIWWTSVWICPFFTYLQGAQAISKGWM